MLTNENTVKIIHEIKNSVTLINSYLQLLEKKYPEVCHMDYWSFSKSEIQRLRSIVTELSQIKFGCDLQTEIIDLKDFIHNCCDGFHSNMDKDGIICSLSLCETPLLVSIDSRQFRHAIINLLKNSCEAMHYCGEILINAYENAQHTYIRITDFGDGISPDIINQIFDPFITTKEDGSGLGLNITKEIITAHGGEISVESKPKKGCTFTICLPSATSP